MEKRTFLAIILSIFVLFLFQGLMGGKAPKASQSSVVLSQPIENKEVKSSLESVSKPALAPDNKVVQEKITDLENENILVRFSNVGGTIKSVDIKNKEFFPVANFSTTSESESAEFDIESKSSDTVVYVFRGNGIETRKIYKNYFGSINKMYHFCWGKSG